MEADYRHWHESSDDILELYALGRLPAVEVEKIEEHLLICDSCRDRLDEVGAFALAARTALRQMPLRPRAPFLPVSHWLSNIPSWHPALAITGALLVLILAIGMYRAGQRARLVPVAALQLTTIRGASIPSVIPARELDVAFAEFGGASKVMIVDERGAIVWAGVPTHRPTEARVKIQTALPEGEYSLVVYSKMGAVIQEYTFRISR